jgi:broad specificity phosphatase PhoE
MRLAILARHAESEFSVCQAVNGDPTVEGGGLTATGRDQARALGMLLLDDPIDLCVTTEFRRTQETANLALAGRDVPRMLVPELNDIRFGSFEGGTLEDYRAWAHSHGPADACPGGGESRADAAARFARGYRRILERPELTILIVAHGLPIRYLLAALIEQDPAAIVEPVPYAETHRISAGQLERATERLERWSTNPVFG